MYFDAELKAIGTWNVGYRPTMFRITYDEPVTLDLDMHDTEGCTILWVEFCESGVPVEIPAFSKDIGAINLGGEGGDYLHITNIEFYPAP